METEEYTYFVPFTQYIAPNGKRKPNSIELRGEPAEKAKALVDAGWDFGVEILSTGMVSMTAEAPLLDGEDDTYEDIELSPNTMEIYTHAEALVDRAYTVQELRVILAAPPEALR